MQPEDDLWLREHRWRAGALIRAERERHSLSQLELGRLAGIDIKTVSRAENGIHAISLDQLARIARALGVPSARLLPDERPPGPTGG